MNANSLAIAQQIVLAVIHIYGDIRISAVSDPHLNLACGNLFHINNQIKVIFLASRSYLEINKRLKISKFINFIH